MRLRTTAGAIATLAAAAAVAIPAASAQSGAHSASRHTVVLKNIRFHPSTLSIHRGDTVTWTWRDAPTEHNVTGKGFKSRTMAKGSFSVRFNKKGTFNYRCTIHGKEGMTGKVLVR
jgi:plastocyanin